MIDNKDSLFKPSESMRDLQFLEELEKTPNLSQRELSNKFGIALGVTNACLKRMIRRGLIRLKKVPPRRIGYYLTPQGFAEKAKLSMTFLTYNIHHYARLKAMITERFLEMVSQGVKRVIFWGVSDEMEIAYIILQGTDMELVAIVGDNDSMKGVNVLGRETRDPHELRSLRADAVLITSILETDDILRNAQRIMRRNSKIKLFTIM
jgi:DNA-binding MarR family transcriptional regulator